MCLQDNTLYTILYVSSNGFNSRETNLSLFGCTEQFQVGINILDKMKRAYVPSSSHGRHTNNVMCQREFEMVVRSQLTEVFFRYLLSYKKRSKL